jgi:thiol:disulfide interchange protein
MLLTALLTAGVSVSAQTVDGGQKKAASRGESSADAKPASRTGSAAVGSSKYDPSRNAGADIKLAMVEAERTGKHVMVEVGGEWCIWCHRMDEFFVAHPDLLARREANFVMVKVNFSDENKNEAVLSSYPEVAGYPHIFILSADGTLLQSQNTGDLEDGQKSYNLDKFMAFLKQWSPESK